MRLGILNVIYKLKSAYFADISSAVALPLSDIRAILTNLIHEGYLFPVASSNGPYRLTNRGREYRLELEKAANAKAKNEAKYAEAKAERAASEKKQFSDNLKVAVISSLISIAATLLLQHANIISELIKECFF